MSFGTLPAGAGSGTLVTSAVNMVDDESTATRVSYAAESDTATEGAGPITVTVQVQPAATAAYIWEARALPR